MPETTIVEIVNKKGLHARAAAKFVKCVGSFDATISVFKTSEDSSEESPEVGGASILGLLMLGADLGSRLHIRAEGAQEKESIAALRALIESRFGEPE